MYQTNDWGLLKEDHGHQQRTTSVHIWYLNRCKTHFPGRLTWGASKTGSNNFIGSSSKKKCLTWNHSVINTFCNSTRAQSLKQSCWNFLFHLKQQTVQPRCLNLFCRWSSQPWSNLKRKHDSRLKWIVQRQTVLLLLKLWKSLLIFGVTDLVSSALPWINPQKPKKDNPWSKVLCYN